MGHDERNQTPREPNQFSLFMLSLFGDIKHISKHEVEAYSMHAFK